MRGGLVPTLAGLATLIAIAAVIAFSVGAFRGSFTPSAPVTVLSPRAGLMMNNNARVTMRGVEVGKVESIEALPNGQAAVHLAMNPSQLHLIPANVQVEMSSPTVFGAKYVQLMPPAEPSPSRCRPDKYSTPSTSLSKSTRFSINSQPYCRRSSPRS